MRGLVSTGANADGLAEFGVEEFVFCAREKV